MKRSKKKCAYHCEIEAAFAVYRGQMEDRDYLAYRKREATVQREPVPLENISPRMLAKQLRELEADGLVIRTVP